MDGNPYAQLLITGNISYFIFKLQYVFWTSPENKYFLREYWIPSLMSQWWTEEGVVCCHLLVFRFFIYLVSKNLFTMKVKLLLTTLSYKETSRKTESKVRGTDQCSRNAQANRFTSRNDQMSLKSTACS